MEKDIVAAILRHLKSRSRCFAWKTHGGMYGTAGMYAMKYHDALQAHPS